MKNKNTLFLFANPEFDKRFYFGISKLYQIFCKKYGYNLNMVDCDFLSKFVPEDSQKLVIAGGDGTIHTVLNAIPDETYNKYIFGIIPGGTANELAKALCLPIALEESAELIVNSKKISSHSVGIVNNRHKFATGFLYGVAGHILQATPTSAKHILGCTAFHLGIIKFLLESYEADKTAPHKFKIDSLIFKTNYLLINNASLISKGLRGNDIDQENKDLFSVIYLHSRLKAFDMLRIIIKNFFSDHILQDPAIAYRQFSEINLEFEQELNFLLDGESYKFSAPVNISHFEKNISVIC